MINPTATNFVKTGNNYFVNTNWIANVIKCPNNDYKLSVVEPVIGYDDSVRLRYNKVYCKEDDLEKFGINLIA